MNHRLIHEWRTNQIRRVQALVSSDHYLFTSHSHQELHHTIPSWLLKQGSALVYWPYQSHWRLKGEHDTLLILEPALLNQLSHPTWSYKLSWSQQNLCCQSSSHLSLMSFPTFLPPSLLPPSTPWPLDPLPCSWKQDTKINAVSATVHWKVFFWTLPRKSIHFSLLFHTIQGTHYITEAMSQGIAQPSTYPAIRIRPRASKPADPFL